MIAWMIPSVVIGAKVGRSVLAKLDEAYFLLAFRAVLIVLATKLIVVDGIGGLVAGPA